MFSAPRTFYFLSVDAFHKQRAMNCEPFDLWPTTYSPLHESGTKCINFLWSSHFLLKVHAFVFVNDRLISSIFLAVFTILWIER